MVMMAIGFVLVILSIIWKRFVPVAGVKEVSIKDIYNLQIVDVRDYNTNKCNNLKVTHIPYAYLPRCLHEIENHPIHLIGESQLEINLAIRFLKKHGYTVASYSNVEKCVRKKSQLKGV